MEISFRTAGALLDVDALSFNEVEPFVYASRKIGPIYVDVRQLSKNPGRWADVVSELVSKVRSGSDSRHLDVVSGGELADLLFSIPVAMRMAKPHVMIRKAEKRYGMKGRIVGALEPGQRVVHVSDLITYGASAVEWVKVIREAGGVLSDYFAVFDRKQGGDEALAAVNVRAHALVSLDAAFLRRAAKGGILSDREAQGISSYLQDSEAWAERFLTANPGFLRKRIALTDGRLTQKEGIEILTNGYPSLLAKLGPVVAEFLHEDGLREPVESIGYKP